MQQMPHTADNTDATVIEVSDQFALDHLQLLYQDKKICSMLCSDGVSTKSSMVLLKEICFRYLREHAPCQFETKDGGSTDSQWCIYGSKQYSRMVLSST